MMVSFLVCSGIFTGVGFLIVGLYEYLSRWLPQIKFLQNRPNRYTLGLHLLIQILIGVWIVLGYEIPPERIVLAAITALVLRSLVYYQIFNHELRGG